MQESKSVDVCAELRHGMAWARMASALVLVATIAACASETVTREVPTASSLDAHTSAQGDTRPLSDKILAWQREGYTLMNTDGETYFCRKETKTGSRLAHETVCLTEKQMDDLRDQTQRSLRDISTAAKPKFGV
jgi:hypothetical protein